MVWRNCILCLLAVADIFVNGTLGPQPVGNAIHGGVGLRINY
jgi:hypothetical protein